jgi:thiamine-monophosphate kinase
MEFRWIDWIRRLERGNPGRSVAVGIGDDAAVWSPRRGNAVVLSVDCQVEGVHFKRSWLTPREIGRRAVMAALSDLAAMAARPAGVLLAVVLEEATGGRRFRELHRGMRDAAAEHGAAILGGNLSSGPFAVTVTVVGEGRPGDLARRSGARPGDELWVSGAPGLARLGLSCLERGTRKPRRAVEEAIRAYKRPRARVREALHVRRRWDVHAMIDVSDGLGADVGHVLEESSRALGTALGAELDETSLLGMPHLPRVSSLLAGAPIEALLAPSDDYEICFAAAPSRAGSRRVHAFRERFGVELTRIGRVVARPGLWLLRPGGRVVLLRPTGWSHFA